MTKKSVQSLVVTLLPQKSLGSSLIRKPHLLLPPLMMMSRTHHLKTLPSFSAPSNVKSDDDGRRYLHKSTFDEIRADLKRSKFLTAIADRYVKGALVRLAFHRDGEILIRLPGTIMRSDGIIATSASRLSFLETSKQLKDIKVDVDFRMGVRRERYEGVLLDGDLCSNIAFVRIGPRRPIPQPVFAKTSDLFSGRGLVASSCVTDSESRLTGSAAFAAGFFSDDGFFLNCSGLGCPKPSDFAGRFNGNAIANEEENSESSRQIIKACVRIRHGTTAIGGCLVVPGRGVVGIIHHEDHFTHQIEATPGLGMRNGVIDGAISISAVQWRCNADKSCHEPRLRLKAFFGSLYRCLARGARAVLQVYPESLVQRELILGFAMRAGFAGGVVVDYPHSTKKRKEYLVLTCGPPSLTTATPNAKGEDEESCSEDEGSGDEENQTVCISDRHRPRKKQRITKKGKGRDWVLKKKEQMRKKGNHVPPDTKYTARKRKARF